MRSVLHALTLVTALAACGSSASSPSPSPVAQDAAPAADTLDVCALVPKATADLIFGGAANDPRNQSGRADSGTCTWHGATRGDVAIISVTGSGTDAALFAQLCAVAEPPFPMLAGLGLGVAACGRFEPGGGGNLWIQLDATTTTIGIMTTTGTQDQALAILRDFAARLPAR